MFKTLFILLLTSSLITASDYNAKNITENEYLKLLKIDTTLYAISTKEHHYSISEISLYIYNNLAINLNYSRLKIAFNAKARSRTSEAITADSTGASYSRDRNDILASIAITYPIFDQKEANERQQKIISTRQKITNEIADYFKLKAKLTDLSAEIEILTALEIRNKARKLDAVGSFDEWLDILKKIKKSKADYTITEIEKAEKYLNLLNYVSESKQKALRLML